MKGRMYADKEYGLVSSAEELWPGGACLEAEVG